MGKGTIMGNNTETIEVLHVDDDPAMVETTAAFLERSLSNLTIQTELSPERAIERVRDESFDCIISDYEMPGLDGLEFFEKVREDDPRIPFILFTGKGSEEIASQALNTGMTGYFQKGGGDQLRRLANRVRQAVTERRTQEIADRYSTVIEALEYPVYVVDEAGNFEFVNDPLADLTGYDTETIIGNTPDLIKNKESVALAESKLKSILSEEGPDTEQFEIEVLRSDGELILCRDHMAVLPYEGEQFRGSVGILRNISKERRREQELKYKTRAMDEAPIGITMSDPTQPDNPMVYVNGQFERLTGYDREEVLGCNCRVLQGPETEEERIRKLREAIDAGEPASVVLRNYKKNGEMFWNRVSVTPIHNDDGTIVRWFGFQEDVTERIESRQELERQNERLEEFASVVAHDLRSPLTIADGQLELAREERASEHLDIIANAHDRMDALIGDLLTLAREGDRVSDTEAVDLGELSEVSWQNVETANATIHTRTERTLRADQSRLAQLLENLIRNAVEHGGESATVTIGDIDNGFYVEDDGRGIPEGKHKAVFDSGYSTIEGGTGFGLSIVKQIADAHGWEIRVTHGSDGGARFEITGVEFSAE